MLCCPLPESRLPVFALHALIVAGLLVAVVVCEVVKRAGDDGVLFTAASNIFL